MRNRRRRRHNNHDKNHNNHHNHIHQNINHKNKHNKNNNHKNVHNNRPRRLKQTNTLVQSHKRLLLERRQSRLERNTPIHNGMDRQPGKHQTMPNENMVR
ncbi:Uncharacterised protein [uncultured archaeon]|nr:Uncharacterised protein [uncultured archaeon]